jgi:hypothetical protein
VVGGPCLRSSCHLIRRQGCEWLPTLPVVSRPCRLNFGLPRCRRSFGFPPRPARACLPSCRLLILLSSLGFLIRRSFPGCPTRLKITSPVRPVQGHPWRHRGRVRAGLDESRKLEREGEERNSPKPGTLTNPLTAARASQGRPAEFLHLAGGAIGAGTDVAVLP